MGIYNDFGWGTGSSFDPVTGLYQPNEILTDDVLYGQAARLEGSAQPFRAIATNYDTVFLTWSVPQGDYNKIRLVRSNDGYPETAEDGVILWEYSSDVGGVKLASFEDGPTEEVPLVQGRFVYYRIWIRLPSLVWKVAGDAYALVPRRHSTLAPDGTVLVSTQNKVLDVLPRVYTSASQSPIDEVDETSDLFRFLQGFSFELDRTMTYIELLLPLESGRLVSPELLLLQSLQLGMPIEPYLATKQQRRLAREALFIYKNKGTLSGIEAFAESLTGFAPDVSASPNLVLSRADSSFTNGVGFWRALGGCTINSIDYVATLGPLVEPYVDDARYLGEVVVSSANARITSGTLSPKLQGTPVTAGTPYIFSGYGKTATGTMDVTGYVTWYDQFGNPIPFDATSDSPYWPPITFPQTPQELTDEWTYEIEITDAVGDGTEIVYTTDGTHSLSIGDEVIIVNVTPIGFNGRHKTITAVTTDTFTIDGAFQGTFVAPGSGEPVPTVIKQTGRFEIIGVAPGGTVNITNASISSNQLTFTVSPYNPFVFGNTVIVQGTTNGIYDGNYIVQAYTPNTFSVVFVASDMASISMTGTVTQGYPDKGDALVIDSASVTNGTPVSTALIKFTTNHEFVPGDYVEVQGISDVLSFGVHTVLTTPNTDEITFALPSTVPTLSFPSGPDYGTAREVLKEDGQVTATAYPPAVYAGFDLVFQDTGTVYLDLLQMATFDVADFHEARAVDIFFYPTKSNYLKNPGFNPAGLVDPLTGLPTWDIKASGYELVDRTSIGRTEDGYSLKLNTTLRNASSYEVTDDVVTVTLTAAHSLPEGATIVLAPSPAGILSGSISSGVVSLTLSDATGLAEGDFIVIDNASNGFNAELEGLHEIDTLVGATITFSTAEDDESYPLASEVYGIAYKYTPVYGSHTITDTTSTTIDFEFETADTASITVPMSISTVTELYSTTAAVPTGKYITASFYAKLNDENEATSLTEDLTLALTAMQYEFSYSSGTLSLVGTPQQIAFITDSITVTEDWQQFSLRIYIPPVEPVLLFPGTLFQIQLNPVYVTLGLVSTLVNTSIYIDHPQIEASFAPTDYIDGDLPPEYGAEWEAGEYTSATHLYPNLAAKMTRLQQELPNYLPFGSSFLIEVYGSKYYLPRL